VLTLIWLALLLAAAQPTWLGEPIAQSISGREMLLAVDLSESMTIEDMEVNGQMAARIDAVKSVVSEFVRRRQGDRLGLILFGSQAYSHVPLTFDLKTLRTLLLEAQPGFAGKYTAIGDAIGLSVKRLLDRPEPSRVIVLLTDGANTAGSIDPVKAAELAATAGIKIYTIGVGANEMEVPGIFGSPLGSRRINPSADLDEKSLQKIAELTGGRYFRASNTRELDNIYRLLDQLEPTGEDQLLFRPRASLAHWPLALAFIGSLSIALRLLLPLLTNPGMARE
jgi:Ca-activated chloride channel family protein